MIKKKFFSYLNKRRTHKELKLLKINKINLKPHSYISPGFDIIGGQFFEIGKNTYIGKNSTLHAYCKYKEKIYHPHIFIGDNVYIGNFFTVGCCYKISIGSNSSIASFVTIFDFNHGLEIKNDGSNFCDNNLVYDSVSIGENCWIGEKATILKGVVIGNHVIIGANSVVTHSIPSFSMAAGNPAKIIKTYDSETGKWIKAKR